MIATPSSYHVRRRGQMVSSIHSCANALAVSQTHSTPAKMNSYDRVSCKAAKLQKTFLRTKEFLFFLRLTSLSKLLETKIGSRRKKQELRAFNQPNPQIASA